MRITRKTVMVETTKDVHAPAIGMPAAPAPGFLLQQSGRYVSAGHELVLRPLFNSNRFEGTHPPPFSCHSRTSLTLSELPLRVLCHLPSAGAALWWLLGLANPCHRRTGSGVPPGRHSPATRRTPPQLPDDPSLTLFPHSDTSRYWISGQANIILQWHPAFPAKYSGPNSLHAAKRKTQPRRSTRSISDTN